jgi:hypothetical protein
MKLTTTHDPHGGGHPRLIFAMGGQAPAGAGQREFELLPGVTAIGSGADADLRLGGLEEHQCRNPARRRRRVHLRRPRNVRRQPVDGPPVSEQALRTGDRIELGNWTLSYSREEFADHGRPYGGRQGGEFSHQQPQDEPRARGTSASGGSERKGPDPGEYF